MNAHDVLRAVDRLAGSIDENRWALAALAAEARDAGIRDYAEVIGRHKKVSRSPWTVRHWAHVADFRKTLRRTYDLPFSAYERACRFGKRLELEAVEEALETAEQEGVSVEELGRFLAEMSGATVEATWRERLQRAAAACRLLRDDETAPDHIRDAANDFVGAVEET
jgi:hypothetical protein